MKKDWHGLVRILEIKHLDKDGNVLWQAENLYNMLHSEGEALLLKALFVGGKLSNDFIPTNYYFGLDGRTEISAADTLANLVAVEPSGNGYQRAAVSSTGQFVVTPVSTIHQANSPIVSFAATTSDFNLDVNYLFMTNIQSGQTNGTLIASVPLTQTVRVTAGQSISMRMGLSLRDVDTTTTG